MVFFSKTFWHCFQHPLATENSVLLIQGAGLFLVSSKRHAVLLGRKGEESIRSCVINVSPPGMSEVWPGAGEAWILISG